MDGTRKAIWVAFGCNLAIAVSKLLGAWTSGSTALLAEGLHSSTDCFNQVFLFLGLRLQERQPTPDHPFGFGRERFFWTFVAAVFIFVAGALVSIYEGVEKCLHPHPLGDPRWAFAALAFALVMESWSLHVGWKELAAKATALGRSPLNHLLVSRDPTISAVVLEDLAAIAGVAIATAGVALSGWLHDPRWDGAGSIGVGLVLVWMAFTVGRRSRSLLIGMGANPEERERIDQVFEQAPAVVEVIDSYTLQLSPQTLLLAAHVRLAGGLDTDAVARVVNDVEADLARAVPSLASIFIEVENLSDAPRKARDHVPL